MRKKNVTRSEVGTCARLSWIRKYSFLDAFLTSSSIWSFHVSVSLIVKPSSFVLCMVLIGVPSMQTPGNWGESRLKDITKLFSLLAIKLEQIFLGPNVDCIYCFLWLALLAFRYVLWYRSIVNIFPRVEDTWDSQVINNQKKKPGTQFCPLWHSGRHCAPLWDAVLSKFDSLRSSWKEVNNPVDYTIRNIDLLQFVNQNLVVYEVKGLSIIKEEDTHRSTVTIRCFEPLMNHTNEC